MDRNFKSWKEYVLWINHHPREQIIQPRVLESPLIITTTDTPYLDSGDHYLIYDPTEDKFRFDYEKDNLVPVDEIYEYIKNGTAAKIDVTKIDTAPKVVGTYQDVMNNIIPQDDEITLEASLSSFGEMVKMVNGKTNDEIVKWLEEFHPKSPLEELSVVILGLMLKVAIKPVNKDVVKIITSVLSEYLNEFKEIYEATK